MRRLSLTTLLLVALPLLLAACARAGGGGPGSLPDNDGDTLANSWEEDNGLDPDSEDTDEDGWTDDEEVYGHADPDDDLDHPYIGGWERSPVPSDLESTGMAVGDIVPNFSLMDQYGEYVNLWSFYGRVIEIETVAEW